MYVWPHTLCITHDQFGGEGDEPPSGDYKIKNLLHTLHTYSIRNFEHHIEFTKLSDVMHMKMPNIIHNVNLWWLSMVSLWNVRCPNDGYWCTKFMMTGLTWQPPIALAYFCHCWKLFVFLWFLMHRLICVCDYLNAVKVCHGKFYSLYSYSTTCFHQDAFLELTNFVSCHNDTIFLTYTGARLFGLNRLNKIRGLTYMFPLPCLAMPNAWGILMCLRPLTCPCVVIVGPCWVLSILFVSWWCRGCGI